MLALRIAVIVACSISVVHQSLAERPAPAIAAAALEVRWNEGAWTAANRAHGFRAVFGEEGALILPRIATSGAWEWSMQAADAAPVGPVVWGNQVRYRRDDLSEWWVNDPSGLQYALEIRRPQALVVERSQVHVQLAFRGDLRAVKSSESIDFLGAGRAVIRVRDVLARDATGRELRSRVALGTARNRAEVVVKTDGAAYPITIHALVTSPTWTVTLTSATAIASAGDVNGDGFEDVIVGDSAYSNGETAEGAAFVYLGSASGPAMTPSWTVESNQESAWLGNSVAGAGDVNGDGYGDVIVGAWHYGNGEMFEGRAYVYHGSPAGLSTTPAWTTESDNGGAEFGYAVAGAGDVNGDGYADVIVGCYRCEDDVLQDGEGWALVYHGSSSGLSTTAAVILQPNVADERFGGAVAGAGDVNGDGYADVIVGAHRHHNPENNEGGAFVYLGSSSGVASTAVWSAETDQMGAQFGISVGGGGDVNGDGYSDVIVGSPYFSGDQAAEGRVFVYYGSASGPTGTPWTAESNQGGSAFGWSVGSAGDVNGDGFADVIVGANTFGNGRTFVYHGSATGLPPAANWTELTEGDAFFGVAVAGAGDVNGDGFAEVIIASATEAFVYDGGGATHTTAANWTTASALGGEVGASVSGAGDVNGDGYSDLIVGSPGTDSAIVFHGSASGFGTTPNWTVSHSGAYFGVAVSGAGDVNGDGFADVIVGARRYENGEFGEGRAFVYLGSASGLSPAAAWTAESDQVNAELGVAVAGAGDVNGDGYADVIVGAYFFDNIENNEGRAFVYHGSANGLAATPAWSAESNQSDSWYAAAVAGAGDVNGDGYADVIVGAYRYDDTQANEGRAFVYHGSASGLSLTAHSEVDAALEHAWFGYSVSGVGDVDGDGFADVMVGAPVTSPPFSQSNEGRAYLFRGSASGIGEPWSWVVEGNADGAWLGKSVAGAGDVNGDGFADSVVGVPFLASGGRAWVFYGNEAGGRSAAPRQLRGGSNDFVSPWGLSHDSDAFRVRTTATSSRGRIRVKLEVEACPQGTAFGDGSCATAVTPAWTDVTASGAVQMTLTVGGLSNATLYHWRARTRYAPMSVTAVGITAPPMPSHGPWRRFHAQWRAADIRVIVPVPPAAPAGVVATALTTGQVDSTWTAVVGAASYQIDRKAPGGTFVQIGTAVTNAFSDDTVSAATAYLYRVRAVNSWGVSPDSPADLATTILFTDDPLTPGTIVKAVHLGELRTAVNAVRALAGSGAASFTDTAAAGVIVKAVHIEELRAFINAARTTLGLMNPSYTDSSLDGLKVKAVHFQEVRERVR